MNLEQEIGRLRGEAAATQMVLISICVGLRNTAPGFESLVRQAFDNAEHVSDVGFAKVGGQSSDIDLDAFRATLERLRAVALGGKRGQKHAI